MSMTDGLVEGRHVFYEDPDGTHAAIVAKAWGDGSVNLAVLDFNGSWFAKADVKPDPKAVGGIVDDGKPTPGTWRWMYHRQGTTYTPGQQAGSLEPASQRDPIKSTEFKERVAPKQDEVAQYTVGADPAVPASVPATKD